MPVVETLTTPSMSPGVSPALAIAARAASSNKCLGGVEIERVALGPAVVRSYQSGGATRWRLSMPALSNTPARRSNKAFAAERARGRAPWPRPGEMTCGGTAVASERRLQVCMRRPYMRRRNSDTKPKEPSRMTPRLMQAALLLAVAACGSAPSSTAAQAERRDGRSRSPGRAVRYALGDGLSCPAAACAMTNVALVSERDGKLWLVDVDQRQPAGGDRRAARSWSAGRAGWAMSSPHPDFAGNQRVYLSFVEAGPSGTSGAALGYGRCCTLGEGAPRRVAGRLQGHLAAVAQGRRQRPFRPPHRLRARRDDLPVVGRPAEDGSRRRTAIPTSARSSI